ncbi:hypothetical protein [uncultured Gemella sp.]|uniref:hypothetical protein n=1 Tax=uncultured Gemella sp. TaxID=254352 RepID=UPI0028D6EA66|nr:hypothetical protein [uncultured Gemella sp.]
MKKISKVATASALLFTLANPLAVFAENKVENISTTSSNKLTQDITVSSEEVNGEIVFHVSALRDTYDTIVYATINGKNYTYNLGNLKKGQVSRVVQPGVSVNKQKAVISKESSSEKSLPNTSVVRELVEKTVLYSVELNGNVIEAKVVYKAYDLVEKNSNTVEEKKSITENKVKDGAIVKPEVLEIPEYKEILGGAIVEPAVQPELPKVEESTATTTKAEESTVTTPKVEKSTATTPKAEEPTATTPKAEEPAAVTTPKAEESAAGTTPKAEESTATTPKVEEPTATTPKAEEPAAGTTPKAEESAAVTTSKAEESAAGTTPKAEESTATTPKAEEPAATTNPKVEESTVATTPKAEESAAGTTPKVEEPAAGTTPKAEESAATTNPKAEESAAGTTPKAEEPAVTTPRVEEPAVTTPRVEEPAVTTPRVEEPAAETTPKAEESAATTNPKAENPTEEVAPKDEKIEEAKKDGKDIIEKISSSKLSEIEKVKDEAEKTKLKEKLNELKDAALKAINNAKDHDAAVEAADEYQTKIDGINVPGEELPAPNFDKNNLTNGRNEGTTIDNGSTVIGHASGEATAVTQPEGASASTGATSQPKAATASTGAATQPEAATESPASTQPATEPTSNSTSTEKPQPVVTSETVTSGTSSFRNAPEVQVRAKRVAREVNQPDGTVNISYNYDGMPDINGFLSDPGENNTVAISNSATEDEVKELVKAKIQAKAQELAKYGYKVKEEIVFEQDTIVKNFNYVVTFTKEKTGTTGFRIAPEVQVRAKKVVKRDLSNKTKQINIYYNLTALKDIAGALGEVGENNMLTLSGNATKEDIKKAIEEHTKSQIDKLNKQGFKVTSTTDLDQIVEGSDSYDYVVEFTKEAKIQSAGNTGFRKAPATQRRAKRSTEAQENVNVNIYFNLKTLPGIAGALDVDGDTTIKLPKNATVEQVKAAIQTKIAKVKKRGYKVNDAYFGARTEQGYDFVVEFTK